MSWEFEPGSDACARCESMVGLYEDAPTRPHPNCHCQIVATQTGGLRCWYETRGNFYPSELPAEDLEKYTPDGYDPETEVAEYWYYDVYVECCDGSLLHKVVVTVDTIDMTADDWAGIQERDLEAIEQACAELEDDCPECDPNIV